MRRPALAVLALLVCGAAPCGTAVDEARAVAERSGLLAAACPLAAERTIPAWFRYEQPGGLHVAEAAVLLPVPAAVAADVIERVEAYPSWALLAGDGSSVLHALIFDPATGRGQVRLGDSDEGTFEGVLHRERAGEARGVRIEMLGGRHVKDAAIEVVTLPSPTCDGGSVATLRMTWRPGLMARLFAGGALFVPATFTLAIRDDLAGHLLLRSEAAPAILGTRLADDSGRRVVVEPGPGGAALHAGERLLRLDPAVLRLGDEQRAALERLARGEGRSRKDVLGAIFAILAGRHDISGYDVAVSGAEGARTFVHHAEPGSVGYAVDLVKADEGFSLGIRLSPP